jgi:hypothetical protein
MIYILLSNETNNKYIFGLQVKIMNFLKEKLKNLDSKKYKIIYCPKHIIEKNIEEIDIYNDYVLWHANVAYNNLSLVKKYINSIVILEHKTVLIQKISNRNPINENMALNHNFDLMYIEEEYNDVTNLEWKLVMQPRVQKIETIINKINNNGR